MLIKRAAKYYLIGAVILLPIVANRGTAGGANRSEADRLARLAMAARAKGEIAQAHAAIEEAIRLDPTWDVLFYNRASLFVHEGVIDRAISDCDTALRLAKKPLSRHYELRSLAYRINGEFEKAIADARKAIELDPDDCNLHMLLAGALFRAEQWAEAVEEFSRVIKQDPTFYYALVYRGAARCNIQDVDGGMADLERAIELDPRTVDAYVQRIGPLLGKGDDVQALRDCDRVLQTKPCNYMEARNYPSVYRARASIHRKKGNFDGALSDLSEAIRLDPRYPLALLDRGQILGEKKEFARALADFTEFIRLCPRDPRGYVERAFVYSCLGNIDSSIADLRKAQKLSEDK